MISLGMLDRLALVLTREFQVEADAAETLVRAIGSVASLGPAGDHPHAVVGGGVYPLRDEEDRHVLEVAIAGEADLLVTANMGDFDATDIRKVGDGARLWLYPRPGRATWSSLIPTRPATGCGLAPCARPWSRVRKGAK